MTLRSTILRLVVLILFAKVCVGVEATAGESVTTTLYVGREFEVRDHEQPVKYVFNGPTRLAQITGSLSSNSRLQRLRLRSGWNSVSLAVTATNLLRQLNQFDNSPTPLVQALYRWQPATRNYASVASGETVAAGGILWLKARTNALVAVTGVYAEPTSPTVEPGGNYVSSPGLERWSPALPNGASAWKYKAPSGTWEAAFTGDLGPITDAPLALGPGDVIYVQSTQPVVLEIPAPAQRVLFYHPDHLGSSSVVTDAAGQPVEETAFYPFGSTRHEQSLSETTAHYGFTQKERDPESGLQYFGHRYLHPGLGRWISTDPLLESGGDPNPYAYVKQSPLNHFDPDGAEVTVVKNTKNGVTKYEIKMQAVLLDVGSKKFTQQELAAFAGKLKTTIEKSFNREKGKVQWTTTVNLRVINDASEIGDCDHLFRIVDVTKHRSGGSATVGGKVMDIAASSIRAPTPDQVDHSNPANKNYTWEFYQSPEGIGAHEFGHSLGLRHNDTRNGLMRSGETQRWDDKTIELEDIQAIERAYNAKKLNQPDDINALRKRR